jgi:hypothetical protein
LRVGTRQRANLLASIAPAGMMGDRADVIFANPEEISGFISSQC